MGMGRYLVEAHLLEGRPVAELAASHGVHRSWIYKLLARFRAEGETRLEPRSRCPRRSPSKVSERWVSEILALREQLSKDGFDAGAQTIHAHLSRDYSDVPSPLDDLARSKGTQTRQTAATQAPPQLLRSLLCRAPERVLADRHHLLARGRDPGRD
jgi:hypothetical protein